MNDDFAKLENDIKKLSFKLWENPELPLMEYKSCEILTDYLSENNFKVEKNIASMKTAFKAVYGSGRHKIALLAEYDALKGISNSNQPYLDPLGQECGHGCLHNFIGAISCSVATEISRKINKYDAQIIVIGCPAEEMLYGKVLLAKRGTFDDVDILLTCHVDYQNGAISRPTLSAFNTEFIFEGISAHSGASYSSNALDAAELAISSIERVHYHKFKATCIEHIIKNGGDMPNIVPSKSSLWFNIRDVDFKKAEYAYKEIKKIINYSSEICSVKVKENFISSTKGYLPNDTLAKVLLKNMKIVGKPIYTAEEMDYINALAKNFFGCEISSFNNEPALFNNGFDPYSQDDGAISHHIPLGRVNWALPKEIYLHNRCATSVAGSSFGLKGALMAGKTIYLTVLEILEKPEIIKEAKTELIKRNPNYINKDFNCSEADIFLKNPKDFWYN